MVASIKKGRVRGRYFNLVQATPSGQEYSLCDEYSEIQVNSIIRMDANADSYFVLPQVDLLEADKYFISEKIVKLFKTEVDQLLS